MFQIYFAGLIHANHGHAIIEYLFQQLKGATTDVSDSHLISLYLLRAFFRKNLEHYLTKFITKLH